MDPISREHTTSLFTVAGFTVLRIWRLPNQYHPYHECEDAETTRREAVYRESRPWWLVKTECGLIEIGPRKRVLQIDWSDTPLRAVVTTDEVTKSDTFVHAYSMLDAAKYLTELKRQANIATLPI